MAPSLSRRGRSNSPLVMGREKENTSRSSQTKPTPPPKLPCTTASHRKPLKDLKTPPNSAEKVLGSNPNPGASGSARRTSSSSLDLIPKGSFSRTPKEKGRERACSAARAKNRTSNEVHGSSDSSRKVSISGSGRIIIPAQNGLKKNCGLHSCSGSVGSGKGLAEDVRRQRHIQERKKRISNQRDGSRCQEIASPNARRALRVAASPSQKVLVNNCASPLSGLKGRYGKSVPRKDGVFTPRGAQGDSTPAPNCNGKRGDLTPAPYSLNATPEQRSQVTPPVQPSVSPDIHSQSLDEVEDGDLQRCFGAGHVMAPVGDRRKCRPRGILIAGEASFAENTRLSLLPLPALASVKWMSPSSNPPHTPSPQTGRPLFCVHRAAPCSATSPSAFLSETQNLTALTPSGSAHQVPFIRAISSSGLTRRTGYLDSTPSSGVTSKLQNLIATPSTSSSKFQNHVFTPSSGSSPEFLNLHPTYPHGNKQDLPNLQANSTPGFNSQVLSRYPSNLDISPEYRFSPDISSHCGDFQETTPTRSSQLGIYPGAFPQDSKPHRSCLSLANQVIPSQCAACSDRVSSSTPKVSSIARDTSRQEMQVPFSRDITLARISWREGLVSRIFKLSNLDFCDLNLDRDGKRKEDENESMYKENHLSNTEDNVEYSCPFDSNLQPDAPFGSFEYMSETNAEKSDPLVSSLFEENILSESLIGSHISSASPGLEPTEHIDAEDITSSADRDWTFFYKNQLFEEAT